MNSPEKKEAEPQRPAFAHPSWSVGVVLIFAVLFLVAGVGEPIWLLIGSPFILTLAVYIGVRLVARRPRTAPEPHAKDDP